MPTYHLFIFDSFPTGKRILADGQIKMIHTDLSTELTYTGQALGNEFETYQVIHPSRVHFKGTPYHHKDVLDEVTERHRFAAYVNKKESLLITNYNKIISNEAIKRLNTCFPSAHIRRPHINLNALLPDFKALIGSYFRDIQIPHLRSSALFGADVDQADFYRIMSTLGQLSAVMAIIPIKDEDYRALITREYSITLWDNLTEDMTLSTLLNLRNILDRALIDDKTTLSKEDNRSEEIEDVLALALDLDSVT